MDNPERSAADDGSLLPLEDWVEDIILLDADAPEFSLVNEYCRRRYPERANWRELRDALALALLTLDEARPSLVAAGIMEDGPASLPRPVAVALHELFGSVSRRVTPGPAAVAALQRRLVGHS